MSRPRTNDARGRAVTQLDPYELHLLHRHDVMPADVLAPLAREIGPGFTGWKRWVYWTSCLLGAGGIATVLVRRIVFHIGVDSVGKTLWAVNLACWLLAFGGYWYGARRARAGRVRRVMLARRRCPHCGYDLRGLPVAAAGATVCPECGCHWQLPNSDGAEEGAVQ